MAFPVWDEAPVPYKAVAFNFLWVLVCNLCLTAIISGIIIDSFGEKRAKRDEMADDNNNFCFICNFERDEFERNQIDYEDHIKHYHYMWHYIWLIMHLEDKPREDYTGAEEYIWQLYSKKNIMFFPIKQVINNIYIYIYTYVCVCVVCVYSVYKCKIWRVQSRRAYEICSKR